MVMKIGRLIQQQSGYKAFIPNKFPPENAFILIQRHNSSMLGLP